MLHCNHPTLNENNNEYYPLISWKKNGQNHPPDGNTETAVTINSTFTGLLVKVERSFESGTYYNCLLILRMNGTTVVSNSVYLHPQGKITYKTYVCAFPSVICLHY